MLTTAGDATLSSSDPGRMTNATLSLEEPLRVELAKSVWTGPASNETVGITSRQLQQERDLHALDDAAVARIAQGSMLGRVR